MCAGTSPYDVNPGKTRRQTRPRVTRLREFRKKCGFLQNDLNIPFLLPFFGAARYLMERIISLFSPSLHAGLQVGRFSCKQKPETNVIPKKKKLRRQYQIRRVHYTQPVQAKTARSQDTNSPDTSEELVECAWTTLRQPGRTGTSDISL